MKIDIKYDGALAEAARKIENGIGEITASCAAAAAQRARELCPVDTGRLRDSIRVERDGNAARVSANTDYAAYVEFGTSKTAPQPYLIPAVLGFSDEIAKAAADAAARLCG